jgi:hypothetical protein
MNVEVLPEAEKERYIGASSKSETIISNVPEKQPWPEMVVSQIKTRISLLRQIYFCAVLWSRNYFFRIRNPFSTEFWIRIRILFG